MSEKKKSVLAAAIVFALFEIVGAVLLIFVPVSGTGNGGFVPAVMIVLAVIAIIAFLQMRSQKQNSAPKPTSAAVGAALSYYILALLSLIFSRSNRAIADTFLLSAAICVCCTNITQYIASRKNSAKHKEPDA